MKHQRRINSAQLCLCLVFVSIVVTKLILRVTMALSSSSSSSSSSHRFSRHFSFSVAFVVDETISLTSSILATMLADAQRRHAHYATSATSLTFWTLVFCLHLLRVQHHARNDEGETHGPRELSDSLAFGDYFSAVVSLALILTNCLRSVGLKGSDYDRACAFSRWTFFWIVPTLMKGAKEDLDMSDLDPLPDEYATKTLLKNYEKRSRSSGEIGRNSSSPVLSLIRCYQMELILLCAVRIFYTLIQLIKPLSLGWIIDRLSNRDGKIHDDDQWKISFFFFLIFFLSILECFFAWNFWWFMNFLAVKVQNSAMILVFRKSLSLDPVVRMRFTTGEIVNLMSVDARKFFTGLEMLVAGLVYPLKLILVTWLLYNQLGAAIFAGYAVLIFCLPLTILAGKRIVGLRRENMIVKDERVKLLKELLCGIKVVKFNAWEKLFVDKVSKIREKELESLKRVSYWKAALEFNYRAAPSLVNVVAFLFFVLSSKDNLLTPKKAFVSLVLFDLFLVLMWGIPEAIYQNASMWIAGGRIDAFLKEEDRERDDYECMDRDATVRIEKASFSWNDNDDKICLWDVSLDLKRGESLAVIGPVGSGKSTLLLALLREVNKIGGRINVTKNVAYVPQRPWIQNCSVKDNVLFGKDMDPKLYREALRACALERDLTVFPAGDETEIGERGVNLSGGQKMRISLARAIYADAELYLLDDPLASVDRSVADHIFENVLSLRGMLRGKSRILVTNDASRLVDVDKLLCLQDGRVVRCGNAKELMSENPEFSAKDKILNVKDKVDKKSLNTKDKRCYSSFQSGKLIANETPIRGVVSMDVFVAYFKKYGGGMTLGFALTFCVRQFLESSASVKLSHWVDELTNESGGNISSSFTVYERNQINLIVYSLLRIISPAFLGLAMIFHTRGAINAARRLQEDLLKRVVVYPMSTFDTVPLGRIMNRFSSDVEVVDSTLPEKVFIVVESFAITTFALLVISWKKPSFLAVVAVLVLCCSPVKRLYIEGTRQLKRLEFISRSPIFSAFHEALDGISIIRAFRQEVRFEEECVAHMDDNMRPSFLLWGANRWISFNLGILGCFVLLICSLYVILSKTISAGEAGLIISLALQITEAIGYSFREIAFTENLFVAVERLKEYAGWSTEGSLENQDLESSWRPRMGRIKFENYGASYRKNLGLALEGLNFCIEGGKRVGVVGRTGAGKSSLALALFRIFETTEGWIEIDGWKIKDIPLRRLRSSLSIIPQDPVIFSGTLRWNLDPCNRHDDDELWRVLSLVNLDIFVAETRDGLDTICSEGGENLSLGQRQLVCLARAILSDAQILVLDEATASVDVETDRVIQRTIRSEFLGRSVITIAHRLDTVMDYDVVIVMEDGKVVEFDDPKKLIEDDNSAFYSLTKNFERKEE